MEERGTEGEQEDKVGDMEENCMKGSELRRKE